MKETIRECKLDTQYTENNIISFLKFNYKKVVLNKIIIYNTSFFGLFFLLPVVALLNQQLVSR